MLKMTVGAVLTAYETLTNILNRNPLLPQAANYRLSRLYKAVEPEGKTAEEPRVKLVMQYGKELETDGKPNGRWEVQEFEEDGKTLTPAMTSYREQWTALRDAEIEVNIEPVSIGIFGDNLGGLTALEITHLGDLITD